MILSYHCVLFSSRTTYASSVIVLGALLLLTGCLAQGQGSEGSIGTSTATTQSASTATFAAINTSVPTLIPTMPDCLEGALLYLKGYAQDERGRTLYQLNWVCSNDSVVRLVVSDIHAFSFAISLQGDRVAFGDDVLEVMDLSSGKIMTLSREAPTESILYPSWSPDGEYIVYKRHRSTADYSPIEVIHVPSGTVSDTLIPNEYVDQIEDATVSGIVWLPRGDQILLYGNVTQDLYLLDVVCDHTSHVCVASRMREIPVSRGVKESPAVSPDGTRIAALCFVPDSQLDEVTLCILDFNGKLVSEISLKEIGLDYIYNLSWSPDGSRIAFDDVGPIYILTLSDHSVRKLDAKGSQPVWLP